MNAPIMNKPVPEGRYATLPNDYRIHYLDEGQGTVVVFLHGSDSGACGYSNFKGNYPALVKSGYRVILPDLIGYGYSDNPDNVQYPLTAEYGLWGKEGFNQGKFR